MAELFSHMTRGKAQWVCTTCKFRKKACDKLLPKCTYCRIRGLPCTYDAPSSTQQVRWVEVPNKISPLQPAPLDVQPVLRSRHKNPVDWVIHDQVNQTLHLNSISISQLGNIFFRSFHKMLPILEEDFLHIYSSKCKDSAPPAELSLVALSVCLLTLGQPSFGSSQPMARETLYTNVKMSYGSVQAIQPTSVRLIQAGLFIAAYEYACARPIAAHLSIGMCLRIASVLCSEDNGRTNDGLYVECRPSLHSNIRRAIFILERLILCEVGSICEYNAPGYTLEDTELFFYQGNGRSRYLLPQDEPILDSFEHQVQATLLLDQVLAVIRATGGSKSKTLDLVTVSNKIQGFLSTGLAENGWAWGASCSALAIAIRSLFLLHQYILIHEPSSAFSTSVHTQLSYDALNTATQIMTDTSHDHVDHGIPHIHDTFPLCGGYNLQCAIEHIEKQENRDGQMHVQDLMTLRKLYDCFCSKWQPF